MRTAGKPRGTFEPGSGRPLRLVGCDFDSLDDLLNQAKARHPASDCATSDAVHTSADLMPETQGARAGKHADGERDPRRSTRRRANETSVESARDVVMLWA